MPTLDWIGKKAVVNHHREVPYRLLHCDKALSAGAADAGNLLVQGDNLLALKALLPYYAGKVKCIYIDPPYNTGNENWVYNDNVNSPEIRQWLGRTVGKEAEDLSRHDKWLCMMYPRLALLKEFLAEDGAIIVHIDEHEAASLVLLMDETFGRNQSLGQIVWDKGNPKGDSTGISFQHEFLVAYARNKDTFVSRHSVHRRKPNAVRMVRKAAAIMKKLNKRLMPQDLSTVAKRYELPSSCVEQFRRNYSIDDAREEYAQWVAEQPDLSGGEAMYKLLDPSGRVYRLVSMAWPNKKLAPDEYFEPLKHPVTGLACPVPERGWRNPPGTMKDLLAANLVEFGPDDSTQPQRRYFLDENLEENLPSVLKFAGSDDAFFQGLAIAFENPKPAEFARLILDAFTDKSSLILDSFAGSGTTGHAVLALNKADSGTRRFILAEMDEELCRKVTSQRLTRVIDGYSPSQGGGGRQSGKVEGLGGGYRFCTLGEPLFDELGQIRAGVKFPDLAAHIFFTETGAPIPQRATGKTPLLGVHDGKAVYLLFNGVMGDKRPQGGNVLTGDVLRRLPAAIEAGPKIIYGESCRLGADRLRRAEIVFKQVPYEIKVS